MKPRISIVIPARDEAAYLPRTLAAINCQTYREFETLVVANACRDDTAEVARRHSRVIVSGEPGQSVAENLGAAAAQGEILLFLDADVRLEPTSLERIARSFDASCSVGTFEAQPSNGRLWHQLIYRFRNFVHQVGFYRSHLGGIFCYRDQFLAIGGFDPRWEPRSNRHLIRRLLRHGSFCYLKGPVTVSTRRYEEWGFWKLTQFWTIAFLRSLHHRTRRTEYPVIR